MTKHGLPDTGRSRGGPVPGRDPIVPPLPLSLVCIESGRESQITETSLLPLPPSFLTTQLFFFISPPMRKEQDYAIQSPRSWVAVCDPGREAHGGKVVPTPGKYRVMIHCQWPISRFLTASGNTGNTGLCMSAQGRPSH